ncbi:MAG: homoserine O-acetyltransferase/O-succinyltransferase family protein [Candidatus Dormibacteria bacterium]
MEIAFVNLMPDPAFSDTEEQFLSLLLHASQETRVPIRVGLFWIRGVPRGAEAMGRIAKSYAEVDTLFGAPLDALIVTGTEPRTVKIDDEAFWPTLSELILWSAEAVPSVILSCLAAHAAAKLFHGLDRALLPSKLAGVYRAEPADGTALTKGLANPVRIPHSRSNDIPTSALEFHGYRKVLCSGENWTAMELERSRARFLMFQGHPEYFQNSLLREYRRDVRRYLQRERDDYPTVPDGYLDESGLLLLDEFARLRTTVARDPAGMAAFPSKALESHIEPNWRRVAETLYSNWLSQMSARRSQSEVPVRLEVAGVPVCEEASVHA